MSDTRGWYVLQGGQWVGPKSHGELQALAASGRLAPSDLVAQEGMAAGISAMTAGFVVNVVAPGLATSALASRGQRLGAMLIDMLLVMAAVVPGSVLTAIGSQAGPDARGAIAVLGSLTLLLSVAGLQVYQWYLLVRSGQTLGKRLVKIRIVRQEDDELPGFGRVVGLRLLLNGVFAMWPPYALMDALFIFGERSECIHDRIARTKVVAA
jgi:uncharacterized RDD family membrane protein YckC